MGPETLVQVKGFSEPIVTPLGIPLQHGGRLEPSACRPVGNNSCACCPQTAETIRRRRKSGGDAKYRGSVAAMRPVTCDRFPSNWKVRGVRVCGGGRKDVRAQGGVLPGSRGSRNVCRLSDSNCKDTDSACERKSFLLGKGLVFFSQRDVGGKIDRTRHIVVGVNAELLVIVQAGGEIGGRAGSRFEIAGHRVLGSRPIASSRPARYCAAVSGGRG